MADLPARSPGFLARLLSQVRSMLAPIPLPSPGSAGASYSADYDQLTALSSMAAFPWVYACVDAISTDLAALPLSVGRRGPDGTITPDNGHPGALLLERPTYTESGTRWRAQQIADRVLAGNSWWVWDGTRELPQIRRLHPAHVEAIESTSGELLGVEYGTPPRTYRMDRLYRMAGISWTDTPAAIYGESAIRPLHDDLVAIRESKRHAAKSSKRGRPDMLFSSSADVAISEEIIRGIRDRYEQAMSSGNGAFFVGAGFTGTPLNWTPRDLEFARIHDETRTAVLVTFGVPAVRLGIPDANYGTAKAQYRQYWERLRHLGRQFEDELSRMLQTIYQDPSLRVSLDFSEVEALQTSYDQRLVRVSQWVALGADPDEAAAYEGFTDAPDLDGPDTPDDLTTSRPRTPDEPNETRSTLLAAYLRGALERYTALPAPTDDPAAWDLARTTEAAILRGVLEAAGAPTERAVVASRDIAAIHHEVAIRGGALQDSPAFATVRARAIVREVWS